MTFRFGELRTMSYPSITIKSFGPNADNEFHAVEKPPKPLANGLFGPFDINSFEKKKNIVSFQMLKNVEMFLFFEKREKFNKNSIKSEPNETKMDKKYPYK